MWLLFFAAGVVPSRCFLVRSESLSVGERGRNGGGWRLCYLVLLECEEENLRGG